jgi:hypothetical protein
VGAVVKRGDRFPRHPRTSKAAIGRSLLSVRLADAGAAAAAAALLADARRG